MVSSMRKVVLAVLASAVGVACSNNTNPSNGGGGGAGITVSAANPASGNGTLANVVIGADSDATIIGLGITGNVGTTNHEIYVTIQKSDNSFLNVEHKWGTETPPATNPTGWTMCDAGGPACAPAQVTVDRAQRKVTFTGLVLSGTPVGSHGTDQSTLSGTVSY